MFHARPDKRVLVEAAQRLSAEHMEVQMPDRLARIRAAIRHYAEALGKAELLRQLRDYGKDMPSSAAEAICAFGTTRKCCGASG